MSFFIVGVNDSIRTRLSNIGDVKVADSTTLIAWLKQCSVDNRSIK